MRPAVLYPPGRSPFLVAQACPERSRMGSQPVGRRRGAQLCARPSPFPVAQMPDLRRRRSRLWEPRPRGDPSTTTPPTPAQPSTLYTIPAPLRIVRPQVPPPVTDERNGSLGGNRTRPLRATPPPVGRAGLRQRAGPLPPTGGSGVRCGLSERTPGRGRFICLLS